MPRLLRFSLPVLLLLGFALRLRADATIRYKNTVKSGDGLGAAGPASSALKLAPITVLQIQGAHAYTDGGLFTAIINLDKGEITLLDAAHHHYATVPLNQLADQLVSLQPAMPGETKQAMENIHTTVSSHKTGRTDTILGIQAEETVTAIAVDAALPAGAGDGSLSVLKIDFDTWTALPTELLRVPALAEINTFNQVNTTLNNPAALLQHALATLPGADKAFGPLVDQLSQSRAITLKAHTALYIPMLAALVGAMRKAQKNAAPAPATDPDAPLVAIDTEAIELSAAPIDPAIFTLPADYQPEPFDDLLKARFPAPAMPVRPPAAAGSPAQPAAPPVPKLPEVVKLAPGQPLAADSLAWLKTYVGQPTSALVQNQQFPALLQALAPDSEVNAANRSMTLAEGVDTVLQGPPDPVELTGGRYLLASARRSPTSQGRALLWVDLQTGDAFGGLLVSQPAEPQYRLTVFSSQIAAAVTDAAQLPPALLASLQAWGAARQLPTATAQFFVNHAGATSVLMHTPLPCSVNECQAINDSMAQADLDAAALLLRGRYKSGSAAAAALDAEQQQWTSQTAAACAAPPASETPLACHARLAWSRARELAKLYAAAPQP